MSADAFYQYSVLAKPRFRLALGAGPSLRHAVHHDVTLRYDWTIRNTENPSQPPIGVVGQETQINRFNQIGYVLLSKAEWTLGERTLLGTQVTYQGYDRTLNNQAAGNWFVGAYVGLRLGNRD